MAVCFVFCLCLVLSSTVLASTSSDVSTVIFINGSAANGMCSQDAPTGIMLQSTSRSITIHWTAISNNPNVTGYEVLYWKVSTTVYQSIQIPLSNTSATISGLQGYTEYYISVRSTCDDMMFGVASTPKDIFTESRAPDASPTNINHTFPVNSDYHRARICWSPINDDQFNGLNPSYDISVTDSTTNEVLNYSLPAKSDMNCYDAYNLTDRHDYIVFVSARSSGGVSSPAIYLFTIMVPTASPSSSPTPPPSVFASWEFYAVAIPSCLILGIAATALIICCKVCHDRKRKSVGFVRDINKNIEDGTIFTSRPHSSMSRSAHIRSSNGLQNRPLPHNPAHTPIPSTSSMHAHLLGAKELSPPIPMVPMVSMPPPPDQYYPNQDYPLSYPMHQLPPSVPHFHNPIDTDQINNRMRSTSVTSPHYPTLSQQLSDISSSSVFTEPSGHPEERHNGPSSPNNPNPYEVPNESETGHHSVSPPAHHHRGIRRPQTAQPAFMSHQASVHHHPVPYAQSNMELFQFNAPPVPPHRSNTNIVNFHSTTPPQEADYSEIPESPVGPHPPHSIPANSSPVASDQYASYSDIPTAISPPQNGKKGSTPPGHVHSLSDESLSSFSTDQSDQSPRRAEASHSKRRSKEVKSRNSNANIRETSQESNTSNATPYLSPSSVKTNSS